MAVYELIVTSVITRIAGSGVTPEPVFTPTDALRAAGLALRPETIEDAAFIRHLYLSVRWPEVAGVADWTDEQKLSFLHQQFDAQCHHYSVAYHDAEFLLVEWNGHPVGRLYLFRNSRDIRVVDIGLIPEVRGQGQGSALLGALFAEGRASSRSVSVHVEQFNPAKTLYERLGFKEINENGPYLLMEWQPA
jgi:ribosomal protein S18 acetylase RimI-like enzyme